MNIYRIYPTLWDESRCKIAKTIYAIDRAPPPGTFPTACSSHVKEDPISTWEGRTFQRILYSPCEGERPEEVTWSRIPAWLSWIQTKGYTLSAGTDLSRLKPYSDIYITGP